MSDREFDTDSERRAYLAGVEDTAKKMQRPPLTLADIRNMTAAEIMVRKSEVDEVLRKGIPVQGGDDK